MALAIFLLILFTLQPYVFCQNLDASMHSYDVHITSNNEGTMLKYISPVTDVKSTMKDIPKVDVRDAKLLAALITKKNADVVLMHPKMSIDGKFPEYSYALPKKEKAILYDIHKTFHPLGSSAGKVRSGVLPKPNKLQTKQNSNSDQDDEEEIDIQSADGPQDETLTSNKEEEDKDDGTSFPPKVPEIPIELGSSSLKNDEKLKEETGAISKQKKKPCQENCSDTYSKPEEDTDDSKNPPQDIPVELGMIENTDEDDDDNSADEIVTDIDQKTPKQFILIDNGIQRKRRSVAVKTKMGDHENNKSSDIRSKKHGITNHWKRKGNTSKRSDIAADQQLLETLENFDTHLKSDSNRVQHLSDKPKPFQGYMNHLAKDVRNVMGQAKTVLTNTGQVVHALQRVLNGASALSSFTKNAADFAKYFEIEPNNATIDYLEERAIVAVLEAQKAASVAKEAANVAQLASVKAKAAERRMEITSRDKDQPMDDIVLRYVNIANNQAERALKAAKYAAIEKSKTESDVRYVGKALQKLTKTLKDKERKDIEDKTNKIFEDSNSIDSLPTSTLLRTDNEDRSIEPVENDADSKTTESKLESLEDSGIVRDRTPFPSEHSVGTNKNPFETLNKEAYSKYFLFKQKQLEDQLKSHHIREETATKKSVMLKRHIQQRRAKQKHNIASKNVKNNNREITKDNKEILGVKSKISSLSNRLEQVIKSIKNTTQKKTSQTPVKKNDAVRRQMLNTPPVHLIPGEYTGFKKDVVMGSKNSEQNREGIKLIEKEDKKSTQVDKNDVVATEDAFQEDRNSQKRVETPSEKEDEVIPDADDHSGSRDSEGKPDLGSSRIVKGPVTVTVNVRHHIKSSRKNTDDPFTSKLNNDNIFNEKSSLKNTEDPFGFKSLAETSNENNIVAKTTVKDIEDPFGFKTLDEVDSAFHRSGGHEVDSALHHSSGHEKENNLLDPFKFTQDTNEGTIYDRAHIPKPDGFKKKEEINPKYWD